MKKQFIGPKEVLGVAKTEKKITVNEIELGDLIEIQYVDGTKELMSQIMFDAVVKEEATDLTTLRQNRMFPVVNDLLTVMLKWNVKINELEFLFALTTASINDNLNKADKKLWNKTLSDRTMDDVDTVLKEKKQ